MTYRSLEIIMWNPFKEDETELSCLDFKKSPVHVMFKRN